MIPASQVAIVNYLNTKPFIYGLNHSAFRDEFNLNEIIPAACAQWYLDGRADLALVPVGALDRFPEELINDVGIASNGAVSSVCIFSEVPIQQVKKVILDYQSRTSVLLAKILLEQYWRVQPLVQEGFEGFESVIQGETAGLIIGDRAIRMKYLFPYVYDLGQAWKDFTGLPFVFAVWLKNGNVPSARIEKFNEALQYGIDHIPDLIPEIKNYDPSFLNDYFSDNIKYKLLPEYWKGMQLFFEKRQALQSLPVALNMF